MKLHSIIILTALLLIGIFITPAYAEQELTVNSVKVKKGDIVTFEYYMSDVKDPIEAAGAYIVYNHDFLEYIDGSIGFDVLQNAMTNVGEDSIYYCAIDVVNGFDFQEEGLVVTAKFKVLDTASGSTVITNRFDEIFTFVNEDEDLSPKDYNSRTVITVNSTDSNKDIHSGINAADVSETLDNAILNSTVSVDEASGDDNISKAAVVLLSVIILIAVAAIVIIFRMRSRKKK